MSRNRQTLDQQPGSAPDIRVDKGSVTFVMVLAGTSSGDRLIIRCDAQGGVWVSIGRSA
jgi:hypothetical protein